VAELPEPYNLMVLVCGYLGIRVSEVLALLWENFNFETGILNITQVFTHGQLQDSAKSDSSEGEPPIILDTTRLRDQTYTE
jgi:integrase